MGLDHRPVLFDYLKDAPRDGSTYARKDGRWVVGGGGGLDSLTENHTLIGDASNEPAEYLTGTAGRAALAAADAAALQTASGTVIGTNVQAYDAGLQSLSAFPTAVDRIAYSTAADTWAETTLTAYGRTLIDDADAATARTTLGVVIGTDVQAYSARLADIAALAVTDGNIIVGNGTNWVAESGATARTSLGLGTMAVEAATDYAKLSLDNTFVRSGNCMQRSSSSGTAEFGGWSAVNDQGSLIQFLTFGSARTGTSYGLSNAGLGVMQTTTDTSTHPSGLAIGTFTNIPFVLGQNNSERMRFDSGGVKIPTGVVFTADTIAASDGSGIAISHNLNMASGKKISTNTKIGAAVAVPASFADLAAVRTYLASILD